MPAALFVSALVALGPVPVALAVAPAQGGGNRPRVLVRAYVGVPADLVPGPRNPCSRPARDRGSDAARRGARGDRLALGRVRDAHCGSPAFALQLARAGVPAGVVVRDGVPARAAYATLCIYLCWTNVTTPIDDYDSLAYHLPQMAEWFQRHGLASFAQFRDDQVGFYPYGWEAVCSLPLVAVARDTLATLPNMVMLAILALAVFHVAARIGARRVDAMFVALLLPCAPLVIDRANSLQVDLPLAAFFLAGFVVAWSWSITRSKVDLALVLACAGLAAGREDVRARLCRGSPRACRRAAHHPPGPELPAGGSNSPKCLGRRGRHGGRGVFRRRVLVCAEHRPLRQPVGQGPGAARRVHAVRRRPRFRIVREAYHARTPLRPDQPTPLVHPRTRGLRPSRRAVLHIPAAGCGRSRVPPRSVVRGCRRLRHGPPVLDDAVQRRRWRPRVPDHPWTGQAFRYAFPCIGLLAALAGAGATRLGGHWANTVIVKGSSSARVCDPARNMDISVLQPLYHLQSPRYGVIIRSRAYSMAALGASRCPECFPCPSSIATSKGGNFALSRWRSDDLVDARTSLLSVIGINRLDQLTIGRCGSIAYDFRRDLTFGLSANGRISSS